MKPFLTYGLVACVVLAGAIYTYATRDPNEPSSAGPTDSNDRNPATGSEGQAAPAPVDEADVVGDADEPAAGEGTSSGFSPRLIAESRDLMPAFLEGIHLGMTESELTDLRSSVKPSIGKRDPSKYFLEEKLNDGLQVLYGLSPSDKRLVQVQVMSVLAGTQAIKPHLDRMKMRYGAPTAVWDCPDTGGVPTRRFTWKKNATTVADVYLVHPGGVSLTMYVASNQVIDKSLADGRCAPVPPDQMNAFPLVTPEMLQRVGAR